MVLVEKRGMRQLCDTKTELLFEYQRASIAYSKAVFHLSQHAVNSPKVEYQRVRLEAERARKICVTARDALKIHTMERLLGVNSHAPQRAHPAQRGSVERGCGHLEKGTAR